MNRILRWGAAHPVAAVAWFTILILSLGAAGTEIMRIEIRFAMMSQEMAFRPIGLFPTINGEPYGDYPALYNILSWLTSFGGRWLNQWTLALPTILLGGYVMALTALIGEKIRKGLGVGAALFSLLSFQYITIFLAFSIDVPVAAAAVTIIYFLQRYDGGPRGLPIYVLMLILAFAVRGPLGLLVSGAAAAGYLTGGRRWKALILYGAAGAATALACTATAMYLIHVQGGQELWNTVLEWQITKRMKRGELYYYFVNGTAAFAATTFFAIAALVMKRKELRQEPLAPWLLWSLLPVILLSIPGSQHLRYMTAAVPPLALIAAWGWMNPDSSRTARVMKWLMTLLDRIAYPAGMLALAGLLTAAFFIPDATPPLCHFCGAALIMTLAFFLLRKRTGELMPLARTAVMFAVFVTMGFHPFEAMTENSVRFVNQVESLRRGRLYFYRLGPDHEDLKYLFYLPYEKRAEVVYLFDSATDRTTPFGRMYPGKAAGQIFPLLNENDIIVTEEKYHDLLSGQLRAAGRGLVPVCTGKMGHRKFFAARAVRGKTDPAGKTGNPARSGTNKT